MEDISTRPSALFMHAFTITIRQGANVLRLGAIGRSTAAVMDYCIGMIDSATPFSICIRSAR